MTDKINELKALIETLDENSPLRKRLQDALDAELKRKAMEEASNVQQSTESQEEKDTEENDAEEESSDTSDDWKDLEEKLKAMSEKLEEEFPSSITGKLEKLMENDEFITASAGFVLGAAVTGLSALAISALKK